MARPNIVRGTYVNLLMGNGATPTEVFSPLCGLTTRTFTHQVNTTDNFIRDCADPEDIPTRETISTGEQWDLSGSGMLNRADLAAFNAAMGQVKNYRFEIGEPATDEVYGGYWGGAAKLTQMQITGDDGEFVSVELTLVSEGPWTFTPAA